MSAVVTTATMVDVQLSGTSTVSNVPSESESEYEPAMYAHVATSESTAVHEPAVAPKSAVALRVQRIVSEAVTVATRVDVQLSAMSIVLVIGAHEPSVKPKSGVVVKAQLVVSIGVIVATSVDSQLSAASSTSGIWAEYTPST
jgi:hypothetical protein